MIRYARPDIGPVDLESVRQQSRESVYSRYVSGLGLTRQELDEPINILDVGCGDLAGFADRTRQLGLVCRVTSIDAARRSFVNSAIPQGRNIKVAGVRFERDNLQEALGLSKAPRYKLILFYNSLPVVLMDEYVCNYGASGNFSGGSDKYTEMCNALRGRVSATLTQALAHLEVGGRAVFYPIYEGLAVFKNKKGGVREKRDYAPVFGALVEALRIVPAQVMEKARQAGERLAPQFGFQWTDSVDSDQNRCKRLTIFRAA